MQSSPTLDFIYVVLEYDHIQQIDIAKKVLAPEVVTIS
jgi:hypothetical protein